MLLRSLGFFLLLSWSFFAGPLSAQDKDALWAQALDAQQNGQLDRAAERYQQLLEAGYAAPELHNNLGLVHYRQGELGEAILHFERALRHAPSHADARHHLQAAQQRIEVPMDAPEPIWLTRMWQTTYRALPASGWGVVAFVVLALAAALTGRAIWRGEDLRRFPVALRWSLGLVVLSALPLTLGGAEYAEATDRSRAVVVAPQAGLRAHPELSSPELDVLSEGLGVRILEERQEWVQVQLPNYVVGWTPSSLIERI